MLMKQGELVKVDINTKTQKTVKSQNYCELLTLKRLEGSI